MGLRQSIAKWLLRDDPGGIRLVDTWGGTPSGVTVTEDSSMRLSTVNACVRVLSEDVASLPCNIYERIDGGKRKATEHPLYELLRNTPNSEMTAFSFKQALMVNLLLSGNAYAYIEYDKRGRPIGLWPIPSSRVEPYRDARTQEILYRVDGSRIVSAAEMLHVPGMSYDGLKGLSPIAYARNAIGQSIAMEDFGGKFFGNGTHLGGVIMTPTELSDEAYKRLSADFTTAYRGLQNAHGIPILEGGAKFEPLRVSQEDAQFLESRKYQRSEIAAIFRVPPHMIGDLERATFSNIEHQSIEYLQRSLTPWLIRLEQELRRKLLTDEERQHYIIEHDASTFLRSDLASRAESYSKLITCGVLTMNEARARENLNPLEGGDTLLQPLNMVPAGETPDDTTTIPPDESKRSGRYTPYLARRSGDGLKTHADNLGVKVGDFKTTRRAFRDWFTAQKTGAKNAVADAQNYDQIVNALRSYYHVDGGLSEAIDAGEFPAFTDIEAVLEDMGVRVASKCDPDKIGKLTPEWIRGFNERYFGVMQDRWAASCYAHVMRAVDVADSNDLDDVRAALNQDFESWEDAEGYADSEVSTYANEMKMAGYRACGYGAIWASTGQETCPHCDELGGKPVYTLAPPLHIGCDCYLVQGDKFR